ncbi:HAMP domain-containing histidine kinase [Myxococcus sp. AM009]|uniref:sensor histidine kinase n=1 Tax=Myxococcus sp. AM009 TaxID=2745137 RepID=UPI001595578A|nr:HAMP domain-containing sensor histidine kinase [Myxococcus sp. AM009]NVJ01948.1 HAMP domain-containing histidine kinase [Myxococcus sp. AM009]
MRLRNRLAQRILVASALVGLLGTLGASILAIVLGVDAALTHGVRMSAALVLAPQASECRTTPGWRFRSPHGVEVEAYDLAQVGAGSPGARPDPKLLARLAQGEREPSTFYLPLFHPDSAWAGASLLKLAEAGPCSLLEFRWPIMHERATVGGWVFVSAVLFTMLAATLSTFVVVHPLLQRLRGLHRAAGLLGASRYRSAADGQDDELGELSRVLDATHARVQEDATRIEAQKHALERHLADVAHDLKTPIASLQLSLELASTTPADPNAALLRQGIEDTVYLTSLVDNLHLACQLGEGIDPTAGDPRVELGQTMERVVRRLQQLARLLELTVECSRPDEALWVRCNPTMLEQALGNLLHNAVTHGEAGGHVVAVLEDAEPGRFRLTVLDDGPGLSAEELERLGERGFRAQATRRRATRGSGLGLSIVRELCLRVGFSLAFAPNPPRGLKVVIEGPRASTREPR